MRRNTASLLKYLIFAALILTLGSLLMKIVIGDGPVIRTRNRGAQNWMLAKGVVPVDPEDFNKIFEAKDWDLNSELPIVSNLPGKTPGDVNVVGIGDSMVDANGKVDWHDAQQIQIDKERTGPGEQGQAYILVGEEKEKEELYKVNGFNAHVSDKISLHRSIPDIRHHDCQNKKYLPKLLNASIVVPFHNEHWSTLLRTVQSVLNRSPKVLLHEVILVDDFSSKERLKEPLDKYLKEHYTNVKVVRQAKREGLIRTRIAGARAATGQVLIFLDSHVEANVNWLPPLLEPITLDYKTVVCPFIDVIDFENFAYRAQDEGARGAFDWEFFYKRLPLLKRDLVNPSEPFKSPVMAGGLFAISTKWFWELGGYDPGLDIWGGEQYELSFKIWQCHGKMVDAPCSRVGHIYRKFAPFPNPGIGDFIARNYKRVAEVWMDEYKEYLYQRKPHFRKIDTGDLSAQFAIREKLQCKPFKWFMTKIAFDLPKKYPMVNPPNIAEGEIRNLASNMCMDALNGGSEEKVTSKRCSSDVSANLKDMHMELTWHYDLRPAGRTKCLDYPNAQPRAPIIMYQCHHLKGNQWFKYNYSTQQLLHAGINQCVDSEVSGGELFMSDCDETKKTQKWKWDNVNKDLAEKAWLVEKDEVEGEEEPPDSDI